MSKELIEKDIEITKLQLVILDLQAQLNTMHLELCKSQFDSTKQKLENLKEQLIAGE